MNKRNNGAKRRRECPFCGITMCQVGWYYSCNSCGLVYELMEGEQGDWVLVPVSAQHWEADELMDGYEVEEV